MAVPEFEKMTGIKCSVSMEHEDIIPRQDVSITRLRILQDP